MRISDNGVDLIRSFEGFRSRPYNDGANPNPGFATVGYGHLIARRPVNASDARAVWVAGQRAAGQLTEMEARKLLQQRLDREFVPPVERLAQSVPLNQNQFDATVSFVYNLGAGILDSSHDFGRLIRQRNYAAAANSMLEYVNPGSSVEAGLRRRRTAERALFLKSGTSPEDRLLTGWRARLKRVRAKAEERRSQGKVAWTPGLRALADRLKASIRAHRPHRG